MGKFSPTKVIEYNFVSLEEMICDIMQEFKDNAQNEDFCVSIAVTTSEVPKFMTAFLSTDRFTPEWIDYNKYDYYGEYVISLYMDGAFWVSQSLDVENGKYYSIDNEINTIVFVSQDVSKNYFDVINNGKNNIVLFDIEK